MQNLRKIQLEMTELFKFEEGQLKKHETKKQKQTIGYAVVD